MTETHDATTCKSGESDGKKCKRFDMSCAMFHTRIFDLAKECPFWRGKY
nr:hypothetical protein [uncultured Methanoregula sp.]